MKNSTETSIKSLAETAHQAIEKHFEKTIKWEKAVKKDEDPEAVHQMRVGMRRLRTAVSRFDKYLHLPKTISDKNIGKLARILGGLRDLDVLQEILENNYFPKCCQKILFDPENNYSQESFKDMSIRQSWLQMMNDFDLN